MPTISVLLCVLNEKKNLQRLIPSLMGLTYPKEKIEYIVVDDNSSDNSIQLLKQLRAKIISVNTHDIELNKGIALHHATGEFVYWLDADMQIMSNNFFELLLQPLIDCKEIIGSFTREFALDCMPDINNSFLRFISYDDLQRDPLYQFISPSVLSTVIYSTAQYQVCQFRPGRIPPAGRMMYRHKTLIQTSVGMNPSFIDLESLEIVSRSGHTLFAFVPLAKIRHYHAQNLGELVSKRLRNLKRDYLPNLSHKYYTWVNFNNSFEIIILAGWIVYANLFFPEFIIGIIKSIKYKDYAFFWQPVVSLVTTDAILVAILKNFDDLILKLRSKKSLNKAGSVS